MSLKNFKFLKSLQSLSIFPGMSHRTVDLQTWLVMSCQTMTMSIQISKRKAVKLVSMILLKESVTTSLFTLSTRVIISPEKVFLAILYGLLQVRIIYCTCVCMSANYISSCTHAINWFQSGNTVCASDKITC